MTNGEHGTQTEEHVFKDRIAWMDYWMRGTDTADLDFKSGTSDLQTVFGPRDTPTTTSRVILGNQGDGKAVGEIQSDGFPLSQTQFTDFYVTADNQLTRGTPQAGTATWVSGSRRQAYSHQVGSDTGGEATSPTGPDEVELATKFTEPTTIAGPITANLFVDSSAPDTELFVQLLDRAPDGTLIYLNRGMLRASHRQIDPSQSQYTADGRIYRPYRPHTERELVIPGQTVDYLIDIFPVGHVFLPGHELVVKLHAPPLDDNDYMYVEKTLPGVSTLHFGPDTPSRLMLPLIPMSDVQGYTPPDGQCPYASVRCVKPR
jgi:predicted acyl esterase